jgi:proteasome lid subunit RPN8/RPN11
MHNNVKVALMKAAAEAYPREICGFVLYNKESGWMTSYPITNTAEEADKFYMDEKELVEIHEKAHAYIIGMYHSHPKGRIEPSTSDCENAPEGRYWIVTLDDVYEWDMSGDQPIRIA